MGKITSHNATAITFAPENADVNEELYAVAATIVRLRLVTPALIFLELHRPLGALLHTMILFIEPTIGPLFGAERMRSLRRLLADPKCIEKLVAILERQSDKIDNNKAGAKLPLS